MSPNCDKFAEFDRARADLIDGDPFYVEPWREPGGTNDQVVQTVDSVQVSRRLTLLHKLVTPLRPLLRYCSRREKAFQAAKKSARTPSERYRADMIEGNLRNIQSLRDLILEFDCLAARFPPLKDAPSRYELSVVARLQTLPRDIRVYSERVAHEIEATQLAALAEAERVGNRREIGSVKSIEKRRTKARSHWSRKYLEDAHRKHPTFGAARLAGAARKLAAAADPPIPAKERDEITEYRARQFLKQ